MYIQIEDLYIYMPICVQIQRHIPEDKGMNPQAKNITILQSHLSGMHLSLLDAFLQHSSNPLLNLADLIQSHTAYPAKQHLIFIRLHLFSHEHGKNLSPL